MGVHAVPRVLVDANVWYSRTCRDWFGVLHTVLDDEPFRVLWTEDILAEFLYHLRKEHQGWDGQRITAIRDRLTEVFELGRVGRYEVGPDFLGPDPDDAHVYAAAVAGQADYLVTFNTKDFTWLDDAAPFETMHPDFFFELVDDASPVHVSLATRKMTEYWLKRNGEADLPSQLRRAECPRFAERVRRHLQAHA